MEETIKKFSLSLVVPVLNEEDIIEETVEIFMRDLADVCEDYEVIVVNDGSSDNTQAILERLAAGYGAKLKVISNNGNLGSGRSLIVGFENSRFPIVATNFADRPFDLKELKNILPLFSGRADFAVVCRFDRSANSIYRKLTSRVNYYLIRLLFGVKVSDFQFVQVYRMEMLRNLKVESNHTFVPPEIIIKAIAKGYKMVEYKSNFYPRGKGSSKCGHPRVILSAICDMFRFWYKIRFNLRG